MRRGYRWMYWATGLPGWMRYGRGYGRGPWWGGMGPYWGSSWAAPPTAEDEIASLKDEADSIRKYLRQLEQRISELEKSEEQG